MKSRMLMTLIVALLAALMASSVASAKVTDQDRRSAGLAPTAAGDAIAAEGIANLRAIPSEGVEEFDVDVETIDDATGKPVPGTEGMVLAVYVTNANGTIYAGSMVVDKTGHALLDLSNDPRALERGEAGTITHISPVSTIGAVSVYDVSGNLVLWGSF